DEGDHLERCRSRLAGYAMEGDRSLLEGLHRAADQGQRQVLKDTGGGPQAAARMLRRGREEKGGGKSPVQGDRRITACVRQTRDAVGTRHACQSKDGVRSLFRPEREEAHLTANKYRQSTIRHGPGGALQCPSPLSAGCDSHDSPELPTYHRRHQYLGRKIGG